MVSETGLVRLPAHGRPSPRPPRRLRSQTSLSHQLPALTDVPEPFGPTRGCPPPGLRGQKRPSTVDQPGKRSTMDMRIGQGCATEGGGQARQTELPIYSLKQTSTGRHALYTQLQKQRQQGAARMWHEQSVQTSEKLQLVRNKSQEKQSALASSAVKQKLQEFVLKKQEAAMKNANSLKEVQTCAAYSCASDPQAPGLRNTPFLRQATQTIECEQHFPLRKTASEPNLKLRLKLKPRGTERRRSSVLHRKDSAPAGLGRRCRDPTDASPGRSRQTLTRNSPQQLLATHCNNSQTTMAEVHPIHRLFFQEGSLIPLTIPYCEPLPSISQGRPAHQKNLIAQIEAPRLVGFQTSDSPPMTCGPPVTFLAAAPPPDRDPTGTRLRNHLSFLGSDITCSAFHSAMVGLPVYYPLQTPTPGQRHRPLGRTRSAPLPQNTQAVQRHLNYQRQHTEFLARLQQQTHLGKLKSKRQSHGAEVDVGNADRGGATLAGLQGRSSEMPDRQVSEPAAEATPFCQHLLSRDRPWISEPFVIHTESLSISYPGLGHRPLSRAQSSPATASLPNPRPETNRQSICTTGIAYDTLMLKHQCPCGSSEHPEHAGRIQSIWSRLQETGLRSQCELIRGRKATLDELQSVHTEQHVLNYGTHPLNRLKLDSRKLLGILSQRSLMMLPCGGLGVDSDTIWNDAHSSNAARMAVGCVVELAQKVADGDLKNGFAIVRPPGHHAEPSTAMGFCFFNSVAIAAKQLLQRSDIHRILIVDWDVHHGNGTQQVFYSDPKVLYISLHRHDDGNFFPGSGASEEVGSGPGLGFNVNVAWARSLDPPIGDAEYLAAFRFRLLDSAADVPRWRETHHGLGGRSQFDSDLRRSGILRLCLAGQRAGTFAQVSPPPETKQERCGLTGEGASDPEEVLDEYPPAFQDRPPLPGRGSGAGGGERGGDCPGLPLGGRHLRWSNGERGRTDGGRDVGLTLDWADISMEHTRNLLRPMGDCPIWWGGRDLGDLAPPGRD